jgi:hypothetical protein
MVEERVADVKLCECGCGQPVSLAVANNRRSGVIKGTPLRFISGHHLKKLAVSRRLDLTNQCFGRLTALNVVNRPKGIWELRCECGSVIRATVEQLGKGRITSCGCDRRTP